MRVTVTLRGKAGLKSSTYLDVIEQSGQPGPRGGKVDGSRSFVVTSIGRL